MFGELPFEQRRAQQPFTPQLLPIQATAVVDAVRTPVIA